MPGTHDPSMAFQAWLLGNPGGLGSCPSQRCHRPSKSGGRLDRFSGHSIVGRPMVWIGLGLNGRVELFHFSGSSSFGEGSP